MTYEGAIQKDGDGTFTVPAVTFPESILESLGGAGDETPREFVHGFVDNLREPVERALLEHLNKKGIAIDGDWNREPSIQMGGEFECPECGGDTRIDWMGDPAHGGRVGAVCMSGECGAGAWLETEDGLEWFAPDDIPLS